LMVLPYTVNGYTFLVCATKIGSISLQGSEKRWEINSIGKWVPEADADKFVDYMHDVYCFRQQRMIKEKVVFYGQPDSYQLSLVPQ
jgi:hypothetical protein